MHDVGVLLALVVHRPPNIVIHGGRTRIPALAPVTGSDLLRGAARFHGALVGRERDVLRIHGDVVVAGDRGAEVDSVAALDVVMRDRDDVDGRRRTRRRSRRRRVADVLPDTDIDVAVACAAIAGVAVVAVAVTRGRRGRLRRLRALRRADAGGLRLGLLDLLDEGDDLLGVLLAGAVDARCLTEERDLEGDALVEALGLVRPDVTNRVLVRQGDHERPALGDLLVGQTLDAHAVAGRVGDGAGVGDRQDGDLTVEPTVDRVAVDRVEVVGLGVLAHDAGHVVPSAGTLGVLLPLLRRLGRRAATVPRGVGRGDDDEDREDRDQGDAGASGGELH